jgi:hypothetical protein
VAIGQISENLLSVMQSANVLFWVMLIDPGVDCLGAPMFKLNLCKTNVAGVSGGYMLMNCYLFLTLCDV